LAGRSVRFLVRQPVIENANYALARKLNLARQIADTQLVRKLRLFV
jgi:hypothetical protein